MDSGKKQPEAGKWTLETLPQEVFEKVADGLDFDALGSLQATSRAMKSRVVAFRSVQKELDMSGLRFYYGGNGKKFLKQSMALIRKYPAAVKLTINDDIGYFHRKANRMCVKSVYAEKLSKVAPQLQQISVVRVDGRHDKSNDDLEVNLHHSYVVFGHSCQLKVIKLHLINCTPYFLDTLPEVDTVLLARPKFEYLFDDVTTIARRLVDALPKLRTVIFSASYAEQMQQVRAMFELFTAADKINSVVLDYGASYHDIEQFKSAVELFSSWPKGRLRLATDRRRRSDENQQSVDDAIAQILPLMQGRVEYYKYDPLRY